MSDKSMTWDEIVDEYFFSHNLREATENSYRKVVGGFSRYMGESILPTKITHRDVLKWRRNILKERHLSTHTWNNKVAHMRAIFNFAITRDLIDLDKNPFNDVVVQKERKKKKTLTREQLTAIYLLMGTTLCALPRLVLANGSRYVALHRHEAEPVAAYPLAGYQP